jgi:hypothetical protein
MEHIIKLSPVNEELKLLRKSNQNIEIISVNINNPLLSKAKEFNENLSSNTKLLLEAEESRMEKYPQKTSNQSEQYYLSLLEKIADSNSKEETNQNEVLTQLKEINLILTIQTQENTLLKANQEKLIDGLTTIESCSNLSTSKLETLDQLIQEKYSSVVENIDYNQKELFEIHNQTNQLKEDIKLLEDALNKHSNELMDEQSNQNKKMLNSIKNEMEKQTNQITND